MALNISKVSDAMSLIGTDNLQQAIRQYKNVVCCALINYIADLETSKKNVSEKLAGAKRSLNGVEKEIHSPKQAKTEAETLICLRIKIKFFLR